MSATLGGQARCLVNVNITRDHSKGHGSAALLRTGISVEVLEVHAQTPVCLASLGIPYEVQAEDNRDKASGATLLLQVTAPSDDCTRPIDKIEVTVAKARSDADEDIFFMQTNVPELRGVAWRKLINQLRAQYASSTALAPPDDSEPEHLNPYFICKWLARGAQAHTITLPDTLVTPSFLHHSPAADTLSELLNKHSPRRCQVQLTISAPADYSHFDFVDLTLTLGQELTTQFARSKDLLDLDSACFFQWLAVTASPELHDPTSQIAVALEFMETLEEWYRHTRIYDVLFDGLELLESMMALASAMSSDDLLNDRLTNSYASMLMAGLCPTYVPDPRFEAALTRFEARMVSHPSQHPRVLNNFGYFFRKASEKMIRSDKLDISISSLRKSLDLLPPDDGLRVEVLQNLVISLYARHRTNRNLEDLEFALLCFREAKRLQERGIGYIPRWKLLLEFAKAAQDVDLEETVRALRESYQLCPLDDPSRYSVLAYLADALFKQYHRRKCISNLDKALAYVKTALELAPSGQLAVRAYLLLRLASILSQKTLDAEAPCDEEFDEAIRIAQESLDIYGRDERRYLALQVLGVAHVRRYLWRKDVEDALAAHQCLSDALAAADAGIPSTHRAEYLASLAEIHLFPDTPLYDIMRACQYSRMCLDDPHTDAVNKLTYMGVAFHPSRVGEHFSSSSSETHSAIADLFLRAVDLLPEIAHLGMDIKSSLNVLRGWESLPIVTSHLCSRSKRYHDAVLTIEKGRAIFWAQALKLRFRANDSVSHELREQLSQLARQLEHNRHLPKRQSSMPIRDSVQSRRLGQQYESVLQQVRELPGNEAFAALSKEELMRIGEQGPVVVLTAHERVCTAYIFTHDDGENGSRLIVHTLAEVSSQKLGEYASRMTETNLRTRNGPTRDMELESPIDSPISPSGTSFSFNIAKAMERAVRMKRPRRQRTFKDDVLRPLFYEVVKPILIALRLKPSSGRSRPRLWWCPTGVFTSLPIHAAGDYFPGGECCSDYVVSSYTPTCTSLLTARKAFSPIKLKDAKVLLAAVPHPFNGRTLTGTVTELKQISDIIPGDQHIPLPDSDNPMISSEAGITSTTILDKLPEASILHLASHGVQDYQSPLDSGFILRDTKLTISQLMPLPLPHAFLAFLSACETAKGDREQTDQAIHLASTMLFAGFKSVVGTLWTMSDSDGPFVASYLYEELFKGGQDYLDPDVVPYALDEVVRRLRGKNASSTRWATFVHLGM